MQNPILGALRASCLATVLALVLLAEPRIALATPCIEWTVSCVNYDLSPVVLGGESFDLYQSMGDAVYTATTISGFSSLAGVTPADLVVTTRVFERTDVTRTADTSRFGPSLLTSLFPSVVTVPPFQTLRLALNRPRSGRP
jgi:hypothetical protein